MQDSLCMEAIWERLSGMDKKIDVVLDNTANTAKQTQIPQVYKEQKNTITEEYMETTVKKYINGLGGFLLEKHEQIMVLLKRVQDDVTGIKDELEQMPPSESISLEPIIQMFPKPKKVNICGFEFLRTSVIITVLIIVSFISLTVNIKQMDDNNRLKSWYVEQSELIRQMQEKQQNESAVSKEQAKAKEKKK